MVNTSVTESRNRVFVIRFYQISLIIDGGAFKIEQIGIKHFFLDNF